MGTANQKSTTETHTKQKKQSKNNTKDSHKITIKENKRRREHKRFSNKIQNN